MEPASLPVHDDIEALFKKARMHLEYGQVPLALSLFAKCVNLHPGNIRYKQALSGLLNHKTLQSVGQPMKEAFIECLQDRRVVHQNLQIAWASLLLHDPDFSFLHHFMDFESYDAFKSRHTKEDLKAFFKARFIIAGLPVLFANKPALERVFTYARRYFNEEGIKKGQIDFAAALALHCFYNEYVFACSKEEKSNLERIKNRLSKGKMALEDLIIYACYEPLYHLRDCLDDLLALARDYDEKGLVKDMLRRQVLEPVKEEEIKEKIEAITPIKQDTSLAVQAQYQENPYPRWLSVFAPQYRKSHQKSPYQILDAGCGTGHSPIQSSLWYGDNAHVTGVDLSLSSLAYAKRKTHEVGIDNIDFYQADILELDDWDKRFDLIVCSGVLHHMKDPMAGWRVLRDLLVPDGMMTVALYSDISRQDIAAARAYIQKHNIESDAESIRAFRQHVFACNEDDILKDLEKRFDFYSLSKCRDSLFDVMEHAYTCLDIQKSLEELEMKFLGFRRLPVQVRQSFKDRYPAKEAWCDLEKWHEFEQGNPDIFRRMYSIWCCRKEERPDNDIPSWLETS